MENSEIIIYQTEEGQTKIDVYFEGETTWLSQAQMVELFQTTKQNVSLHIQFTFLKEFEKFREKQIQIEARQAILKDFERF